MSSDIDAARARATALARSGEITWGEAFRVVNDAYAEVRARAAVTDLGSRVVVPGGRIGTVVGVKTVYVQLDGVGSRNSVDVDRLIPAEADEGLRR